MRKVILAACIAAVLGITAVAADYGVTENNWGRGRGWGRQHGGGWGQGGGYGGCRGGW